MNLVTVLVFAAALAGAIGDIKDAAVILVFVLLNAGLGFWQEHRAERTLAARKEMFAARAGQPCAPIPASVAAN